ncbi:MAG: fibronectin type III domain-containing protein [Actinobacteria bacterium]|nr:fibronectin type III domain-containing protein [Actinomycetota bacterium]
MARLLTFGFTLTALLVGLAAPAQAAHYDVTWTSPGNENSSLSGDASINFRIHSATWLTSGKVNDWILKVFDGQTEVGTFCSPAAGSMPDDEISVEFLWDTRYLPTTHADADSTACANSTANDPRLPNTSKADYFGYSENKAYILKVEVTNADTLLDDPHTETFTRTVRLDNDPLPPANVQASFNSGTQQMTVRWDQSPEPDVTGYLVEQCFKGSSQSTCAGSDWAQFGTITGKSTTSLTRTVTSAGAYRYQVKAQRPAGSSTGVTLTSAASDSSSAVVLETSGGGSGGDDDGGGNDDDDAGSGGAGGGTNPSNGGAGGTTPTTGGSGGTPTSGSTPGAGGGENDRDLPPRLIERTEVDAGYEEALPYGAKPLDPSGGGDGLAGAARGLGLALVPIAGGLALFVFSMQMRYLSHRAGALALATGDGSLPVPAGTETGTHDLVGPPGAPSVGTFPRAGPTPLRLPAGGSFISNWRQLLEPREPPDPDA